MKQRQETSTKAIALALQGGGAHGAFGWGVLDRLLEDKRLSIEGISATSAGAMNAVVVAHGLRQAGCEGGRAALHDFWFSVAQAAILRWPADWAQWLAGISPWSIAGLLFGRALSPYQFNPLNINPLRSILQAQVDFERLRRESPVRLFLSATNVETGKLHVFSGQSISADAVLASACLPDLFQAVEIEGQYFWDGGYVGNPAIFPLIYQCTTCDVVIVHINPTIRQGVPTTPELIQNRINEISFNSSLTREMRVIGFVTALIQRGKLDRDAHKEMFIHSIAADETLGTMSAASKHNLDWGFLCHLRDQGRHTAERWLRKHYRNIGVRSSVALDFDQEAI